MVSMIKTDKNNGRVQEVMIMIVYTLWDYGDVDNDIERRFMSWGGNFDGIKSILKKDVEKRKEIRLL